MVLPPTFIENHIDENYREADDTTVTYKLNSSETNQKFSIKYFGDLFEEQYIVGNEFSEPLVVAIANETKEEIIIFDGCKHGYNAMFCDEYTDAQINNRVADKLFTAKNGKTEFEIYITAYYGIDYDEEKEDFVNEEGQVKLLSGELISFEQLKRDGIDSFDITIKSGDYTQTILAEELA